MIQFSFFKIVTFNIMEFFDCKDGTIINLEHIVSIDTDERMLEFVNGDKIYYNPELFEEIIHHIKLYYLI